MRKEIVWILNGPNLNLIGVRQPEIYGTEGFDDFLKELRFRFDSFEISYFQSNHEGQLCNKLHEIGFASKLIILNAGGLTHTSLVLHDAIRSIQTPVVEVHLSNIWGRESWRAKSIIASACKGSISGFGLKSYELALNSIYP